MDDNEKEFIVLLARVNPEDFLEVLMELLRLHDASTNLSQVDDRLPLR